MTWNLGASIARLMAQKATEPTIFGQVTHFCLKTSEQEKAAPKGGQFEFSGCALRYDLFIASRTASFASPTALWTAPFALSILPSACNFASPVSLPAATLTVASTVSTAPLICSLSTIETVSNLGVIWFGLPASVSPNIPAGRPAVPPPAMASRKWIAPQRRVNPPRPATSARFPGRP